MLKDDTRLVASSFGTGDAGSITIQADGFVSLATLSDIFSRVGSSARGNGGNISISGDSLTLTGGSQISTSTYGRGDSGMVTIQTRGAVNLSGTDQAGNPSGILVGLEAGAIGNGGMINITADSLSLTDGAELGAFVRGASGNLRGGRGIGGTINVYVRDAITIAGKNANGTSSGIFTSLGSGAVGQGGDINLTARSFSLMDRSLLSSATFGIGDAGNITIKTSQDYSANNGQITATAALFGGGNIDINARNILLRNSSDITTFSRGGNGGNITLTAKAIVALEDSDILAFAPRGKGGNITFNTLAFLSDPLYRPVPPTTNLATLLKLIGNGQVDVNASGAISGVVVGVPDISFLQNSLTKLPTGLLDTNYLLSNSCIARSKQSGGFFITGSGGLPDRPDTPSISSYPTGEVRAVEENTGQSETQNSSNNSWKMGDPIVEPQSVYQLSSGQLVLSRECP